MALFDTLSSPADENATATLHSLLKGLRANVTRATVRQTLEQHPDFPSLLSLSEVLTDWKIDNTALQLNTTEQLREMPLPFVAHLRRNGGWYVLVTALQGDKITYTDNSKGRNTETVTEFEQKWSGVVLLAEADEQSGEADYQTNRRREVLAGLRRPFVLISALLILLLAIGSAALNFIGTDWLLLVTKATGLALSGLLVAKQLGHQNALTNRLCRISHKTNCDSVLDSPGAKLWGWLSWADVGFLYFAAGLLTVLSAGIVPTVRPLLHWLALLALPYTIFSIYYQARLVQQWCTLCLAVQVVLLTEGILAVTQLSQLPDTWQPYTVLLTVFLLPTLAWVLIKPLLTNATESQREHNELLRFKRNPDLFKSLLTLQPRMPTVPDDLCLITLGDPDAGHTITMVTNPYCPPCAKTHGELEQLIERNANVKVDVIFLACDGLAGRLTTVAKHLLAVPNKKRALNDWYAFDRKDYADWSQRYPVANDDSDYVQLVQRHCDWCQQANVTATPTLFIDGYQRPDAYSLPQIGRLVNYLTIPKPVETDSL